MALAFSVLRRYPPRRGIRELLVEITGDTAYATGGTAIAASELNLNAITAMILANPYPLVDRIYVWDRTNSKLVAQVPSTGAEAAGSSDYSADKIIALVSGR